MKLRPALFAALSLLSTATPALATQDQDYISGNIGYYDIDRNNQKATQFGGEYRFSQIEYGIHPIVGIFGTSKGSVYGYGGFNWAVAILPNQLYIVPNAAVGGYSQGNGKDLGGVVEFRTGVEMDYEFASHQQLGLAFNHISNASIYTRNPGEETLMLTYSIPFSTVANWTSNMYNMK